MASDEPGSSGPERRMADLPRLLKPLSNAKRLSALLFLRQPRFTEEVAAHLRVSRQAAARHIAVLESMGLVARRAAPRQSAGLVEYVLVPESLHALHEYVDDLVVQSIPSGDTGTTRLAATNPTISGADLKKPALSVVRGIQLGRTYWLDFTRRIVQTIGRAGRCEVSVPHDTFVSAHHAEVREDATGGLSLLDHHSRNGTTLNWRRLPPGTKHSLRDGDLIGVGRTILHLRLPAP